jgi:hypothetical protein
MTAEIGTNQVRIFTRSTVPGEDLYEVDTTSMQIIQQLATWERPAVIGSGVANPEEIISSYSQDDWSGGFGIEDADEGVDTARFRFGLIDGRSPHQRAPPPKTYMPDPPSWASGASMPLGDVQSQYYHAWGSHAAGYDEEAEAFYTTDNNLGKTPLTKGTKFCGYLYVPCGAAGAFALKESNAATGTLAITQIANTVITPLLFGKWNNQLYALNTDHTLWKHSTVDALDDPSDAANWERVEGVGGRVMTLDTSYTPRRLVVFKNRAGEMVLWCQTNGPSFIYDYESAEWIEAAIEESPHPEAGRGTVVWRGEELMIPTGGMDILRYTAADVSVPLSGPSRDHGVPPRYAGQIVDMHGERSTLYYLVKGLPQLFTPEWVEDDPGNPSFGASSVPVWLGGYTGTAYFALSEDTDATGEPTWLHVSSIPDPEGYFRVWWGETGGRVYNIRTPLSFFNPRAEIQLGRLEFADTAWHESIRYDANMVGWDKLASHAYANMEYASEDSYVDISYRTDADLYELSGTNSLNEPSYHPWMRVKARGRTLLWFDNEEIEPLSGEPWREGLNFQWVQFRFDWVTGPNPKTPPIMTAYSMHHVRIPQDASSATINIKVPETEIIGATTPSATARRLKAMQRYPGFVHLQTGNDEFLRCKFAGVTEKRWLGGGQRGGTVTVILAEIGASSNAHQSLGQSLVSS